MIKNIYKLVHPVYGYEVVLDRNNRIVTDPPNMGTYNFYNPESDLMDNNLILNNSLHNEYDVKTYNLKGNSVNDPTTENQRFWRFLESANSILTP